MENFLFIYRHDPANLSKMPPEERQQHMQKWHVWLNGGSEKGWLVNPGDGLKKEGRVVDGKRSSRMGRSLRRRSSSVASRSFGRGRLTRPPKLPKVVPACSPAEK